MKIVDLTHSLEEGMISFPSHWHMPFECHILGRHSIEKRETRKVAFTTHTGTHIDAPLHFIKNGKTLDEISLDKLVGKCKIVNVSFLSKGESLGVQKLKEILDSNIEKKLIFNFSWYKYWNTEKFYDNWPYFEYEAIEYLIASGVEFLGMDTPSPDNFKNGWKTESDSPNHKLLLQNNIVICEYLNNLNSINKNIFDLFALPLKIKNSDGAPIRCIAIL